MTVTPCESWFPKAAIFSQPCLAIHFLEDTCAEAWRLNPLRRIIALIKAPFGTSIPSGKIFTFAAGAAILTLSTPITSFMQRLRISHRFDLFGKRESPEDELDLFDEKVEITIRIDDHGLDILRKPRCVVSVHLPKEGPHSLAQFVRDTSDRNEVRYRKQDHKLPFWVR